MKRLSPLFVTMLFACGAAKQAPPDEPAAEPAAQDDWADGGVDDAGAIDPSAATEVACISFNVCTELKTTPKEAAEAKDRCVGASGESHEGPCSREHVIATCAVPGKHATLFYYEDASPDMTAGRLKGGKSGCAQAKGKFNLVKKK